jgi:hypothetical protein
MAVQEPVEGADRADVATFVEQGGVDLGWRGVGKTGAMEQIQSLLSLQAAERPLWSRPRPSAG